MMDRYEPEIFPTTFSVKHNTKFHWNP